MWEYTETVMDHFRNPRNVGAVEHADGIGEVGSMACGDALRLSISVDENERITDAKFQTFGCASAIASASALTEMVKGMTLDEAAAVTNRDIAEFLGGLPDQKMHCSVLGSEALEAAIASYRTGGEPKREIEGIVVCKCFGITEVEIERIARENDLRTVDDVTNYTKAGGGCGQCHSHIREILARVAGAPEPAEAAEEPEPKRPRLTMVKKIQLIQETIEREIRPKLQEDGGDIELVDVDGDRVVVSMLGRCAMCSAAGFTLDGLVGEKLREFVAADIVVVEEKP
ncbi:Fe-S cluster assembly protein NifU [bacterium]|nr:Fe-S cluster assembly protein NifU [bacterium]